MAVRYERIYSMPERLHTAGAPVIIEKGRLLYDTKYGRTVARVRIRNISDAVISSATVRFIPAEPAGEPLEGEFSDLACAPGEQFGWEETVELEDPTLRRFTVEVTEIEFKNGKRWRLPAGSAWDTVTDPDEAPEEIAEVPVPRKKERKKEKPAPYVDVFDESEAEESEPQKKSGTVLVVLLIVILLAAAVLLYFFVLRKMLAYNAAGKLFDSGRYEEARAAYSELGDYESSAGMVWECDYYRAKELFAEGRHEDAEALFLGLGAYKDSALWAENCRGAINIKAYEEAVGLLEAGHLDDARIAFTALGPYKDSAEMVKECDYREAAALMLAGDTARAGALFESLGDYKDSASLAAACTGTAEAPEETPAEEAPAAEETSEEEPDEEESDEEEPDEEETTAEEPATPAPKAEPKKESAAEEPAKTAKEYDAADWKVGNYVIFGNYQQSESGQSKTPIVWLVLERKGDRALLISRYGLNAQPYYTKARRVTWEDSSVREWLNETFIYNAFTAAEQAAIEITDVDNGKSQQISNVSGGNDTKDKLFLLSYAEVEKYFPAKEARMIEPTAYAVSQGTYVHQRSGNTWWWTRSPGKDQGMVATVNFEGTRSDYYVNLTSGAVRPAIWVDTSKLP